MTFRFSDESPILIVGAGLGGLVLAQALRKRNIHFRIFERDESPNHRGQGYGLALHWQVLRHLGDSGSDTLQDYQRSPGRNAG